MLLSLALTASAAEQTQTSPATAPATDGAPAGAAVERPALLASAETLHPDPVPRDPLALGPDEWLELSAGGQSFSVLYRAPAQSQASGAVLLVSDRNGGAASAARSAQLRPALARLGFHTYLLGQRQSPTDSSGAVDSAIAARVGAVIDRMRSAHGSEGGTGATFSNLVISEGSAGRWVSALEPAGIDGLVFIDVPAPRRRADNWLLKATLPVLMVQTAPRSWPPEQAIGATTELHLLPRQSLRAGGGLVLRTVRGWMKRLSAPAASKRS
ncbi:MAG: DUF3530 family protein [Pseudomonadales bacterium]